MRKILILVIIICSFIVFTCTKELTSPLMSNEVGSISFRISRPLFFQNTTKIMFQLSIENFRTITDTILVSSLQGEKLYTLINNISIGLWKFEVKALDDSNKICYFETLEVEVIKDKIISVELKWGNNAGKAVYFENSENYISINNSPTLNSISSMLTLEAWVKPIDQEYNYIINKGGNKYTMELLGGLRPAFRFLGLTIDYSNVRNYWERIVLYESISENEWTHIVCTYSSNDSSLKIYINGNLNQDVYATGLIQSSEDKLLIGAYFSENFRLFFKGYIDEIRIWNIVRSESEIKENMNRTLFGNEIGLVGYWSFDEIVENNIFLDGTQNNNDGNIIGKLELQDSFAF